MLNQRRLSILFVRKSFLYVAMVPSPPLRFRLSYFVTGLPCMRSSSLCTFRDGGANFVSVLALRFDSGVLGVLFSFVLPNSR